jgi:hypothetical protein
MQKIWTFVFLVRMLCRFIHSIIWNTFLHYKSRYVEMNKNQAYKCTQPIFKFFFGCALSKFFNIKCFELNLQLPNHYKNALGALSNLLNYFLLVILPTQQQFLLLKKRLYFLTNNVLIKNCFARLCFDFWVHKTRSISYLKNPFEPINIFILNLISKIYCNFF